MDIFLVLSVIRFVGPKLGERGIYEFYVVGNNTKILLISTMIAHN